MDSRDGSFNAYPENSAAFLNSCTHDKTCMHARLRDGTFNLLSSYDTGITYVPISETSRLLTF